MKQSMKSKFTQNQAVSEGTFKWDKARLEKYKSKLHELDPQFEIDEDLPKNARIVRHSVCSETVTMSVPYDISRFKDHLKTCLKRDTPLNSKTSNTRSLDAMFGSIIKRQEQTKTNGGQRITGKFRVPKDLEKLWPCPGLTGSDDVRIPIYLQQTQVESAGGISKRDIAIEIFGTKYSLLNKSQKDTVCLKQIQTHRWRLDHLHNQVFAIGERKCAGNVCVRIHTTNGNKEPEHTQVKPCADCQNLLSIPAFLSAIAKPMPSNQNGPYVPHKFWNAAVSEMFAKNLGLSELFSEVRTVYLAVQSLSVV